MWKRFLVTGIENGFGKFGRQNCVRTFASDFEQAQKKLSTLSEEPGVDVKLKIYGLFKQATIGDASGKRPGALDFAGRAKFDSWSQFKGISQDDAKSKYVSLINELAGSNAVQESAEPGQIPGLKLGAEGKIYNIRLNRPDKFNALTQEMYTGIREALISGNNDKSTAITVISASGPYYCSGNDLKNFLRVKKPEDLKPMAEEAAEFLKSFVDSFIDHKKPLIALVHGPAIGISVTTLALCDMVIASDQATFQTPFTGLGYSPEGCSSYTFPQIMGKTRASEMLLFGKKMSAQEALQCGLVSRVIPINQFEAEASKILNDIVELPTESLRVNKTMVSDITRKILHETNAIECELISKRWQGADCARAFQKFMTRKA